MAKTLPKKLNFASGNEILKGYVNMDVVPLKGVDVVWDFNKFPYPFPKNHFTEIYASHAMEHVDDLMKVMAEFYRILKPGGVVKILVPYFANPLSYQDPTHKIWFCSRTFMVFAKHHYYSGEVGFNVVKRKVLFFSRRAYMKSRWYSLPFDVIINLTLPVYERFFPYLLPAAEIHFLLEVDK